MRWALPPEIYTLDDEGYSGADGIIVPPELFDKARRGARYCPERALTLEETA